MSAGFFRERRRNRQTEPQTVFFRTAPHRAQSGKRLLTEARPVVFHTHENAAFRNAHGDRNAGMHFLCDRRLRVLNEVRQNELQLKGIRRYRNLRHGDHHGLHPTAHGSDTLRNGVCKAYGFLFRFALFRVASHVFHNVGRTLHLSRNTAQEIPRLFGKLSVLL